MAMHLNIIHLALCIPGYFRGYLINQFIARGPDDHSSNSLQTKHISKVVELTHSWPEHLNIIHLTLCNTELVQGYDC